MFLNWGVRTSRFADIVFVPVRGIMFLNRNVGYVPVWYGVFVPVRGIMFLNWLISFDTQLHVCFRPRKGNYVSKSEKRTTLMFR